MVQQGSIAVAAHDGYIVLGFVLGLLAFMAVAEVVNRKHASEQAEHEAMARIRSRFEAMKKGEQP